METESAKRGPIADTVKKTIEFPEKDESMGELMISYMGPKSDEFLQSKVGVVSLPSCSYETPLTSFFTRCRRSL